ncbi:MAG: hypothetical protein ACREI8_05900 [Myxococcota bacterium]
MPYERIVYEVENGRARITLNRPERRNALCPPLLDEVLQRLAAENDARGHRAPATKEYFRAVQEKGLAGAFRERDAKFGDGRARVDGPELRDERGCLRPEPKP